VINWTGPLTNPTPNRQLRRMALFSAFFPSSAFTWRRRMAPHLYPAAVWNECKAWFQADRRTYKKPKKNLKTNKNQEHKP
jgi:hypothetical protein